MDDAIQIDNRWYVPATSSRADDRTRVLKSSDGFAVFSRHGEMGRVGLGEQGFYYLGTRHLSYWHLRLAGREPMLLNSTIRLDNSRLGVDQTTPDIYDGDRLWIKKGTVHIRRELVMHDCSLAERVVVTNYSDKALHLPLEYTYAADFHDLFEVRGVRRPARGRHHAPLVEGHSAVLGYDGLDGVARRTRIGFDRPPDTIGADSAHFDLSLPPGESTALEVTVSCDSGGAYFCVTSHSVSVSAVDSAVAADRASRTQVWTDNEQFNDWINRSAADLQMLVTDTRYGPYPYAGVPWFSTPFGRDGLITALQLLWAQPSLARGVLSFLAATQADRNDPAAEAEPGRILHELREGEMAALGEVPFRRYYGTVDATPLFVMLAGRYYRRTGDRALIEQIWPNIERALAWIGGNVAQYGFLSYARHGSKGLVQQGWKDSDDSVFHRDGSDVVPPVALCEAQGYAWDAWRRGAELADLLGHGDLADAWRSAAAELAARFEQAFWLEDLQTYAMALDGEGRPCAVRSSNPGHLLYCGMVGSDRARLVARGLMVPDVFNGWGLRTLAEGQPRYNPMSYHNGSVWPHDTALGAAGMARYGFKDEALTITEGLFNASIYFDLHRLPELFCGFDRLPGQGPTHYPVACAPQAWASGSVFMLIEALLGLIFDPGRHRVHMYHPRLPGYVSWMRVRGLTHLGSSIDLLVHRMGQEIAVSIEGRRGDIDLSVTI